MWMMGKYVAKSHKIYTNKEENGNRADENYNFDL